MAIPVRKFLNKYYDPEDLRDVLEDIGEPVGRTKKERIERIVENWQSYNRDWYELLGYLEWGVLAEICDDFDIYYEDHWKEETLCNKIEDSRILDYRKETMAKSSQKSNKSSNEKELQNKSEFHFHFPESSSVRIGIIATVIVGAIFAGVGMWWTSHVAETTTLIINSGNQELAELLKNGQVEAFNEQKKTWVGELDFKGLDLAGLDLSEVDLRNTLLQNADFEDSILIAAFFDNSNLEKANFEGANLERAKLVDVNLQNANLRNTNLEQANLNRADMKNVILYNSDLKQASLEKTNLQNADLQHSVFLWANLADSDINGAILNDTDFREVQNLPISIEEAKKRGAIVD